MKRIEVFIPLLVSVLVTPVALFCGIISAGGGHGNYVIAKLLFPYTIVASYWYDSIPEPFIVLAVFQFPVYGVVLTLGSIAGKMKPFGLGLLLIHMTSVTLAFVLVSEKFS